MTLYNANTLKRVSRQSAYLEGLLWGSSDKSAVCCMCGEDRYFSLFQKKVLGWEVVCNASISDRNRASEQTLVFLF